jgi:pyruvate kinase
MELLCMKHWPTNRTGGVLTSHKGINLPTGSIRMPSMTKKDRDDLHFGLGLDIENDKPGT